MDAVLGHCDPKFEAVRARFEDNFRELGEVGASVAIHSEGRLVVHLWAGLADRSEQRAWHRDTLVNVYSTTKGLAALCIAQLIDRGQLDLDARVVRAWPEFAAAGKGEITLRQLLGHRAGLAVLTPKLPHSALYDQSTMANALAAEAPHWQPGSAHGYHALTFGFLLGELVQRVAGVTLGQYLRSQIALPFDADVHIGLSAEDDARVAKVTRPLGEATPAGEVDLMRVWKSEPESLTARAFNNPAPQPGAINTRAWRAAEMPSSNGHATALGLSRVYAAAIDPAAGLLSAQAIARCSEEISFGEDLVLRVPTRFGPGFMLSQAEGSGRIGPNVRSFGHPGMGGSLGFADPDARIGFGYVMNRAGANILVGERPRRLIDALYASI
ncbi:MAG TPA: serine hydrolase domain-containing protein [Polyangiales bacterium]|jgi:CubicO group peptidase (beta-lactamase class C family)